MLFKASIAAASLVAALGVGAGAAPAAADTEPVPDELAVVVVGDGATYGNVAGPVTIQNLDSTGARGEGIVIPTEGSDGQHPFTLGVDRDQAGALQQSADRSYVTVGGYDAALGEATNGSAAPETLRVIARIGADGEVDTSTSLDGAYHERHIRGVATVDGTRYWTGGHGNDSSDPYQAGVLTIEHGGDTPAAVTTDGTDANLLNNTRVPLIHDGQLYVSSDRNGFHGVNAVGTGLPESSVDLTPVASAPAGREVPHDFAFIGDYLYVTYTDEDAALVKYESDGGAWVETGHYPGEFWGLTGRVAGDDAVLYATRGSNEENELVALVDRAEGEFSEAITETLAVADPNTAFRGVAFAPGFTPGDGPAALPEPAPQVTWDVRVAGGTGNALSGVLGASTNPVATGTVVDPEGAPFDVEVTSGNQDVVADEDITLTVEDDGTFALAAEPIGTGTTTLTLTAATDDERVGTSRLSYWVSDALPDDTALAHVGMADASAAYDAGDGHILVADDDSNQIRLFGPTFGEPVAEFDFQALMDHPTDREFDLEGAARIDDTIYWVGSMGNSRSGNVWPHRDVVFATEVTGSGADTELEFAGEATGFRDALVAWDNTDGHGFGTGALQFERATTPGYSAEGPNSLNVEGATIAPDGSTLWLGFRSPLVPVAQDLANDDDGDQALIVEIENIVEVVAGDADITVGAAHTIDLDGRAIRDLTETDDGNYLIAAGSADDAGNFAVYGWSGDVSEDPVISTTELGLEGWDGSYEAFGAVPALDDGTVIRVMQDVGTLDLYGTGSEAQDLTREHMKFVSHDYTLDFDGAFESVPDPEPTPEPASLVLSASEVEAGGSVEAIASSFEPDEEVTFTLNSESVELATGTADDAGTVEVSLTIPADTAAGEHAVVAAAESGEARAPLQVLPAQVPPPVDEEDDDGAPVGDDGHVGDGAGAGGGALPQTGAGLAGVLALAVVALLVGAGLLVGVGRNRVSENLAGSAGP